MLHYDFFFQYNMRIQNPNPKTSVVVDYLLNHTVKVDLPNWNRFSETAGRNFNQTHKVSKQRGTWKLIILSLCVLCMMGNYLNSITEIITPASFCFWLYSNLTLSEKLITAEFKLTWTVWILMKYTKLVKAYFGTVRVFLCYK